MHLREHLLWGRGICICLGESLGLSIPNVQKSDLGLQERWGYRHIQYLVTGPFSLLSNIPRVLVDTVYILPSSIFLKC
jgi:hypothetical protein